MAVNLLPPALPEQGMVPVSSLMAHPQNYKLHPKVQLEKIMASLREHGQRKPVPVRRTKDGIIIIAGHGVVASLELLCQENLAKWMYCWVAYVPAEWDDWRAINYMIADNETGNLAEDDMPLLAELLQKQQAQGFPLASLGFDTSSLTELVSSIERIKTPAGLGRSIKSDLDSFLYGAIRQIVLLYDVDGYADMVGKLQVIREQRNLKTNTDVVAFVVNYFLQKEGLVHERATDATPTKKNA